MRCTAKAIWKTFRTTTMLVTLCVTLLTTTAVSAIWAIQKTAQVAALTAEVSSKAAQMTALRAKHKKRIARAVAKERVKGNMKRAVVAVPIAGTAAALAFAEWEYREWLEENPQGGRTDYACEVGELTSELADEMMTVLPDGMISEDFFADAYGTCDPNQTEQASPAPGQTQKPWFRPKAVLPPSPEN